MIHTIGWTKSLKRSNIGIITIEKVYKRMRDVCKIKEEEKRLYFTGIGERYKYEYYDIYYLAEKIIKKIRHGPESKFIATFAGIEKYTDLIVMNNFNYYEYDNFFDLYKKYKVYARYEYNNEFRTNYLQV